MFGQITHLLSYSITLFHHRVSALSAVSACVRACFSMRPHPHVSVAGLWPIFNGVHHRPYLTTHMMLFTLRALLDSRSCATLLHDCMTAKERALASELFGECVTIADPEAGTIVTLHVLCSGPSSVVEAS